MISNQIRKYIFFASAIFCSSISTSSYADEVFAPVIGSGLRLGRGYDSLSGAEKSPCVQMTNLVTMNDAAENMRRAALEGAEAHCNRHGQCVEYNLKQISSSSELRKSLRLDAKASFGFGAYAGDASYNYYSESRFSNKNVYAYVRVKVTNPTESLEQFRLVPAAAELLRNGDIANFTRRCGDSFISARTTGGEFIAIVRIETTSEENKKNVQAKLAASGFTWSASASFADALKEIKNTNEIHVDMFMRGGGVNLPNHADFNQVLEFARTFPDKVNMHEAPVTYLLTSSPYEIILDLPIAPATLVKQKRFLNQLVSFQDRGFELWGDINFILSHSDSYEPFDKYRLNNWRKDLDVILDQVTEAATNCQDNPNNCIMPAIEWPEIVWPKAKPSSEATQEDQKSSEDLIKKICTDKANLDHEWFLISVKKPTSDQLMERWRDIYVNCCKENGLDTQPDPFILALKSFTPFIRGFVRK